MRERSEAEEAVRVAALNFDDADAESKVSAAVGAVSKIVEALTALDCLLEQAGVRLEKLQAERAEAFRAQKVQELRREIEQTVAKDAELVDSALGFLVQAIEELELRINTMERLATEAGKNAAGYRKLVDVHAWRKIQAQLRRFFYGQIFKMAPAYREQAFTQIAASFLESAFNSNGNVSMPEDMLEGGDADAVDEAESDAQRWTA